MSLQIQMLRATTHSDGERKYFVCRAIFVVFCLRSNIFFCWNDTSEGVIWKARTIFKQLISKIKYHLSVSFQILLQESQIAELAKNSGDSSQKLVYLNEQLREKDR